LAKRQLTLGNFALAIDGFRKAIRQNPQSADAHNGLAVAYDRIGRHDLSRESYEQALALSPNDSAILANLARSLAAAGKKVESVAVAAKPSSPGARLERISSREVALVTSNSGAGWAAVGVEATPRRVAPAAPVFAQSRRGVLEIALEAPEAAPSANHNVPVVILNAVGRRGLARRMSNFLEDKGWSKASVGDARLRPKESLMFHAPKDRLAAVQLSRSLPFPSRLVVAPRARQVILFVGRNAMAFDEQLRSARTS
jgi:tetratricopeptide (TPR) repeat protein